jgi:hypothetical protein
MVKPTVCQLRRDSNTVVHLVRADEAKTALVEALKLNANLNLLARMYPSDAILAADVRRSAYKAWAPQARQIGKARNPPISAVRRSCREGQRTVRRMCAVSELDDAVSNQPGSR